DPRRVAAGARDVSRRLGGSRQRTRLELGRVAGCEPEAAVKRRILFVLPRADWIVSNASLITALQADGDVAVALVAPTCYQPSFSLPPGHLIGYPFYAP